MSKYVSVRLEGMKDPQGQFDHDSRRKIPNDGRVDPSLSYKNKTLIGNILESEMQRAISNVEKNHQQYAYKNRRIRSGAHRLLSGIITFGSDNLEDLQQLAVLLEENPPHKLAEKLIQELCLKHLTECTYLVYHADEPAGVGHYHFCLENFDGLEKKLISNMYSSNYAISKKPERKYLSMSEIQDMAGRIFSPIGINRGISKTTRIANGDSRKKTKHRTVQQLHYDMNLELDEKQSQINQIALNLEEIQRQQQLTLQHKQLELQLINKQIEETTAELNKLTTEKMLLTHSGTIFSSLGLVVIAKLGSSFEIICESELNKACEPFTHYSRSEKRAIINSRKIEAHDYGDRITFALNSDPIAAGYMALNLAQAKKWELVELHGTPDFIRNFKEAAHNAGLMMDHTTDGKYQLSM